LAIARGDLTFSEKKNKLEGRDSPNQRKNMNEKIFNALRKIAADWNPRQVKLDQKPIKPFDTMFNPADNMQRRAYDPNAIIGVPKPDWRVKTQRALGGHWAGERLAKIWNPTVKNMIGLESMNTHHKTPQPEINDAFIRSPEQEYADKHNTAVFGNMAWRGR
jgi:hypothetical protein